MKPAVLLLSLSVLVGACNKSQESAPEASPPPSTPVAEPAAKPAGIAVDAARLQLFGQLPKRIESTTNPVTDAKIALGRKLFFETRLSRGNDLSCNSCHDLKTFGVDHKPVSDGHKGQKGGRNAPTVYNAAGHFAQFWDARAATIEEQAKGPILNPIEMAMPSAKAVMAVLRKMPEYVDAFKVAFPGEADPLTYDNLGRAIGAFECTLVTPSRFDKFLAGDATALSDAEKAGFNLFVETGCTTCHNGVYVGGGFLQKVGMAKPWPREADLGRFTVTKQDSDKMMFKVPSLRNIAQTAPYFHDGQTATLDEAVLMMARHQLGKELNPEQVTSIVAFLNSLTGELPAN